MYNKKMRIKWKLIKLMETMKEIKKEELNRIQIPTLVMAGEYDLIKEEETHYISENIKYSVERIIKNGSHFLLSDNFKETYDEIKMFLDAFGGKI
jgi:pimeloyl-ACP methyl ester carboxylesterase